MPKAKQLQVLISHSWMDKVPAEKLSKALNDFCDVWMDYRELKPAKTLNM